MLEGLVKADRLDYSKLRVSEELDSSCPQISLFLLKHLGTLDGNFSEVEELSQFEERPLMVRKNVIYNIIR